ncbi:hypothetical protein OUZ56_017206 [Daphnia magna]|uniref:Uncharacterized protein n=1 Tax=Daphnia magna TaxID=35525 RepID=A0ABR0ASD8_9CRUS|nr:hypothetical protein OUZ56_017206 [Daphnia magna]
MTELQFTLVDKFIQLEKDVKESNEENEKFKNESLQYKMLHEETILANTIFQLNKAPWTPSGFKVSLSLVDYGVYNFWKCFIGKKSFNESQSSVVSFVSESYNPAWKYCSANVLCRLAPDAKRCKCAMSMDFATLAGCQRTQKPVYDRPEGQSTDGGGAYAAIKTSKPSCMFYYTFFDIATINSNSIVAFQLAPVDSSSRRNLLTHM